ncbi:MAG: hypothetical protein ACXVPL_03690 [Actinomycetota bacterium]
MADLGEREPIEVPAMLPTSGNGHDGGPLALGDGIGNGHGPNGSGGLPPRPDTA